VSVRSAPPAAQELFGRRAVPDARDLWYLLADEYPEVFKGDVLPPPRPSLRGPTYDRGGKPNDVSCALLTALAASPMRIGRGRLPSVDWLDQQIRELEGAVGPAVTLRSGCRVLQRLGIITAYAWTYDVSEIVRWLSASRGGLVLGIDWYAAMSRPDQVGLIRAWGRPLGGRAIYAWGYDHVSDTVLLQNSWGPHWGGWSTRPGRRDFKGCARLPASDLSKLLADNGEAVALFKNPAFTRFAEPT
jgi:hypothetical protein